MNPRCKRCDDTMSVCENHPDRPWEGESSREDACGCGAGAPCPDCWTFDAHREKFARIRDEGRMICSVEDDVRAKAIAAFHAPPRYPLCPTRKVPWQSEAEAQAEADRLNASPDGWGVNYPFHCSECGKWHNGRPHKGKTVH